MVVDEANMAGTDQLAAIQARCAAAGAKLLLVGDPRQLGAVGPGGALADVAEHGIRYELADVRRFTESWEGTASLRLREGDPTVLAEYAKHGRLRDGGTVEQAEAAAARAWLTDTLAGRESLLMVRDNAGAARLSSTLRAELVSLGLVAEDGASLAREGWEGVVAGVGDLVQARRNGWELIGHEGNTRAPINRDSYRVTELRPDGGLVVAPVVERRPDGEVLGDPLVLPRAYVAEDVTLAYATTVHAAEGRTVDTAHTVSGAGTDLPGLLVPMTRGRDANTAWVVTRDVAADAETGETLDVAPRTPAAVLADVMDGWRAERSALAEREQADLDARSTMTHVDQLADVVARVVTAGRTAATLDRLTAEGAITTQQRAELAADEAFGSLERLLRTAELAGHDPDEVLSGVLADRDLTGARSPAQVLHSRITDAYVGRLTPHLTSMTDLLPAQVPDEWAGWLRDRAEAADTRRHELGSDTAADPPRWALDALGPVPGWENVPARVEWEQRAGWAAAYRELTSHDDDRDPLGHAPAAGLAEKGAVFRAAHEALDLLDAGAEEADLTVGQLRARYAGYQREEAWAPRNVADELDAAHQTLATARDNAQVWAARAAAPGTAVDDAAQLRAEAQAAAAEAERLAEQVAALEEADRARGLWYVHTAVSRDTAHRSGMELRARGIDPDEPDDRVTADEWLVEHRTEEIGTERDREIHDDYELDDHQADERAAVQPAAELLDDDQLDARLDVDRDAPAVAETAVPDEREVATVDPGERKDPAQRGRLLTVDETTETVTRAQEALATISTRNAAEARRAEQDVELQRQIQLTEWARADERDAAQVDVHEAVDELQR